PEPTPVKAEAKAPEKPAPQAEAAKADTPASAKPASTPPQPPQTKVEGASEPPAPVAESADAKASSAAKTAGEAKAAEAKPAKPASARPSAKKAEAAKAEAAETPTPPEPSAAAPKPEATDAAPPAEAKTEQSNGQSGRVEVAQEGEKKAESDSDEPERRPARARKSDSKSERREARAARPDKRRDDDYDEDDEKPDFDDFGISEFDFSERQDDGKAARVAPPPPSSIVVPEKKAEPKSKVRRMIDPNVLKARLKASKRPDPPKDWGKQEVPASPVTELVVRNSADGKRKELVDVRRDAGRGKRPGQRKREEMTAKDLLEHRRGQVYYPAPNRKRNVRGKKAPKRHVEPTTPVAKQPIQIGDTITVAEISQQMGRKATELIGFLMRNGVMANINQPIDHDTAIMVCEHFGFEVNSKLVAEEDLLQGSSLEQAKKTVVTDEGAEPRPPVVTVMGHVDHGKTSLLDRIRNANVAAGEAGGITQRIAGYQVETSRGLVTFLDTPGHAAFTQMRARGANITDIVILVVAADDGVMPQTREAIDHAKAAGVPIIVAINKIDKPDSNPDRVTQQLADLGLLLEDWGGDVLSQKVSAKAGTGIEDLLEQVSLQAEIMDLKANPTVPSVATVVEGHMHPGRGPVATILVREGTLKQSDIVVVGESIGRVRAMITDGGKKAKDAGPAVPVEILGLDTVPNPGDELRVAKDLDAARELVTMRRDRRRSQELVNDNKLSLQDFLSRMNPSDQKELKLIIKADVQGSAEAVKGSLINLSTPKVKVSVISSGVGGITESDIDFAYASEAIIIGFAVRPDTKAVKAARAKGVDIRTYSVIYEAVDEVKMAMQGLLSPVEKEKYLGRAEVRQTFNVPRVGTIAGCAVVDGIVTRNANVRLIRDNKEVYDGKLASLKRFKDDVREVKEGFECGMGIEKFNDIKVGDIIEAYEIVMTEAKLDEPTAQPEARA
ncbi:MAG: translation initiation factor IF-2, partial [Myxococcota bacterium]